MGDDPRFADREVLVQRQQEQRAESQAVDHATHYTALGVGLAMFACAFYDTLMAPEMGGKFQRPTVMRLLEAALQGR